MQDKLVESKQGKTIELTQRGKSLYNLLKPEMDNMLDRISKIIDKQTPVLRIGMTEAIFFYLVPDVIKTFKDKYPDVEMVVYERDTVLPQLMAEGAVDVCLSERAFGNAAIQQHFVGTYYPVLAFPAAWGAPPAERSAFIDWLRERPMVTYEPGQMMRDIAYDFLRERDISPKVSISCSASSSIKKYISLGLGYSIVPRWCLIDSDVEIARIPLPTVAQLPIYFCEARFLLDNPYVKALRSLCLDMELHPPYTSSAPKYSIEI